MLEINKIYNMDCLEGMRQIDDHSIDTILCDLPYGLTKCGWDKRIPFGPLWDQYERIIKDNGAIILTGKQPFTTDLINSNRDWYRYSLIWLKNISTGFYNANVMPLQSHEDICVFYKHKPTYNPQMEYGFERKVSKASSERKCKAAEIYNKAICTKDYDSTARYPISVLYYPSDKHRQALHPTQKPVELIRYLIETYSNPGDLILDNCIGSGTTAIACMESGRNFIGFEDDTGIYNLATDRINDYMLCLHRISQNGALNIGKEKKKSEPVVIPKICRICGKEIFGKCIEIKNNRRENYSICWNCWKKEIGKREVMP